MLSAAPEASFNPRLTSAARRTCSCAEHIAPRQYVSIRASLRQRGEPTFSSALGNTRAFQSAPHFGSEANRDNPVVPACVSYAVSIRASLRQRGEPLNFPAFPLFVNVSIRASLRQRGEPPYCAAGYPRAPCFNPRLTSAARRTRLTVQESAAGYPFQSAPHFGSEANR